ncbi:MAG: hypothetical protein ABIR24_00175 [Verrucomicrobiota bacterium]
MKQQLRGLAGGARVILLIVVGWSLAGHFNTQAATNLVVDTETKLVPSVGARELMFGSDVAISGATAAVGAQQTFHGAVYIYSLVGTNWRQTQILTAGKPATVLDRFGAAIALSSNVMVVGQPAQYNSGTPREVYIYTNSGTAWLLQQTIAHGLPLEGSEFGSAIGVSGQTIAAGDPWAYTGSGALYEGAVFVYSQIGTNWLIQARLRANDSPINLRLGSSVAIDGDTVLAGASEAAYVFVRNGTNWTQQQKLIDPILQFGLGFGGSVALEGNVGVVTARKASSNSDSGAVYIFVRTGTNWVFQQELILGDNENNSLFGATVAIHNGKIVGGVPNGSVDGISDAGSVNIFQFNGTSWVLAQEIAATDAAPGAALGASVDFGVGGIIAGAPFVIDVGRAGQGAAYIFAAAATNPPVVPIATASPNILFPPNHKMIPVRISVSNHDSFNSCRIISVSSNESIIGKGSPKTSPDWIITGDLTLLLRSERSVKNKAGRIYRIEVACTDSTGKTMSTTVIVTVPPHGKK